MPEPDFQFTEISKFSPETFGEPGMRTFRINADSASSNALIWVEKEQLSELCESMNQLINEVKLDQNSDTFPPIEKEAPGLSKLEFKTNRIAFGYDENSKMFLIDVYDPQSISEETTLRIWINSIQLEAFINKGLEIVSAGRPKCELCKKPINPEGHSCEYKNGHSKDPII
ncbi:MAG: DUF3090 family protein [Dehalococcoidia bacterium]|tara:strand:- start:533 stop:1045 length:513 start_codon:yes stop_codon:yes gene_type:complete